MLPYVVKERKKIPKTVILRPEIFVQYTDFFGKDGSKLGLRIVIAGTGINTTEHHEHIFFAVFNTYQNATEYLWEEVYNAPEICKGIEIAKTSNHCIFFNTNKYCKVIILSDIYTNKQIETTYLTSGTIGPPTWDISIRAFSFDSIFRLR